MKRKHNHANQSLRAQEMKIDKPIVLVGLMGAGKTTVGRRLAKALKLDFVDSDLEIEEAACMSIAEIFEAFGEDDFRSGERRVIARLMTGEPRVIATGGGAFVNTETRALVLEEAISVWLDAEIDTLVERTSRRDTRPLLRNGDPQVILTELAERRAPFYSQADIKIPTNNGPHEDVVVKIIDALEGYMSRRTQQTGAEA
jgi:shikimate kinase